MGWLAGVIVGLALLVAGVLKLADRSWPGQAQALGAPRPVALGLPWVEVVVGAMVTVGLGWPWTAWAAVGLLVAFTALLVVRLAQGRRPVCACFGRFSARPIGPGSVARNVVLIGLAALAIVGR